MKSDAVLDARGLLCPLPVLKARKKLLAMPPGSVLSVLATDMAALIDMPHFCVEAGHALLATEETSDGHMFLIRRGLAVQTGF